MSEIGLRPEQRHESTYLEAGPSPAAPVDVVGAAAAASTRRCAPLTPAMERILEALGKRSPLSPKELARDAFVALTTLEGGAYLRTMKRRGLIHIAGWYKNHNGFTTPLYALGAREDCVRPKFESIDRDSSGMARLVAALRKRSSLDYREAAKLAGLSPNTVKNAGYMHLLVDQRRIHVSGWKRGGKGHLMPLYSVGEGENMRKPEPLERDEVMRRHRQRCKHTAPDALSVGAQLRLAQQALQEVSVRPAC